MPIDSNVVLGHRTRIAHPGLVNIYGCCIGDEVTIKGLAAAFDEAFGSALGDRLTGYKSDPDFL